MKIVSTVTFIVKQTNFLAPDPLELDCSLYAALPSLKHFLYMHTSEHKGVEACIADSQGIRFVCMKCITMQSICSTMVEHTSSLLSAACIDHCKLTITGTIILLPVLLLLSTCIPCQVYAHVRPPVCFFQS